MREISPFVGLSVEEWLSTFPPEARARVEQIREDRRNDRRPYPSAKLLDRSTLLTKPQRNKLLDKVAALVDENYCGRAEMCQQFADLLYRALMRLSVDARGAIGQATYLAADGSVLWQWKHAWVRSGLEIVDGNIDTIAENPLVPKSLIVAPYWGPLAEMPTDRRLTEERRTLPNDRDVKQIWWPDLRRWIDEGGLGSP